MSALTERLAATHQFAWGPTTDGGAVPSCTCQPGVRVDDYPAHLIATTVTAVAGNVDQDTGLYADIERWAARIAEDGMHPSTVADEIQNVVVAYIRGGAS